MKNKTEKQKLPQTGIDTFNFRDSDTLGTAIFYPGDS